MYVVCVWFSFKLMNNKLIALLHFPGHLNREQSPAIALQRAMPPDLRI